MQIYFGGGEVPKFLKVLSDNGAPPVSISFTTLHPANYHSLSSYSGDVLLDSGAYSYNRPDSAKTYEDAYEDASRYTSFISANLSNVHLITEFDAKQLGQDMIEDFRSNFYNSLPAEKFMPVWHQDDDRAELERLCAEYQMVAISQGNIHGDMSSVPIFNQMIARYGVKLHGLGITSKKMIEAVKWSSVSSTSWLSVNKFGDTFVWTGRELKRYPVSYKDRARKTHRTLFIDNGFDYHKIEADDPDELLKLSLWSWQKYMESMGGVTTTPKKETEKYSEIAIPEVGILDTPVRTPDPVIRQTVMIPVMNLAIPEQGFSSGEEESKPTLVIRSESMRICDTCFLKDKCPGFQPNANCLYNIPIEVKTRDQLHALQNSLIEIQSQRVLFMKMAEDMSGGYSDPNLSSEIDRLDKMIRNRNDRDKNSFSMTITASESAEGKQSFLGKMLGSSAAAKVRELESPVNADEIMEAEIVD